MAVVKSVVVLLAGLWFYGAIRAGLFADGKHVPASDEQLKGVEPFSRRKRFAEIGNAKVAYIGLDIARRLERDIPGVVRLEVLEGSAHLPMLEQPGSYGASVLTSSRARVRRSTKKRHSPAGGAAKPRRGFAQKAGRGRKSAT